VASKHAVVVTEVTVLLLHPYLDKTLTIFGKEFVSHEKIKEQLNADIYFAHPYRVSAHTAYAAPALFYLLQSLPSWERGLNENAMVCD